MQAFFLSDEEMGKKDDDHKPALSGLSPGTWAPAHVQRRKLLKRLLIVIIGLLVVYVFIKNMPTDLPIRDHRRPVYHDPGSEIESTGRVNSRPPGRSSWQHEKSLKVHSAPPIVTEEARTYDGPVKFLNLGTSLHAIYNTRGGSFINKNVLFAAASLKSATVLLPMACQMAKERRSYVHFALMSRSELELEELRQVNGIDDSCQVIFHDARPDLSATSTDKRLQKCVSRAFYHINMFMHPQAVIVDGTDMEETYFAEGLRNHDSLKGTPVIELPHGGVRKLAWMTRLDSASLNAWNRVHTDIIIHAYPGVSGSLIRLLKSLSNADYTAFAIPNLIIELPQKIDPPTEKYLKSFQWPPPHVPNPGNVRQLSLRHRIPRHGVSEEESSMRFLESFWPSNPQNSHVLVLSPSAEVSRSYFHCKSDVLIEEKRYWNFLNIQGLRKCTDDPGRFKVHYT